MKSLMWFRADLRYQDNTALAAAVATADELLGIFIVTPKTWQQRDASAIKIQFILENLRCLQKTLTAHGIPLLVRTTDSFSSCAVLLKKLCQEFDVDTLYFNCQYEADELRRDKQVRELLAHEKITVQSYDDQVVLAPGKALNQQTSFFKVFTPFKKTWLIETEKTQAWMPIETIVKQFNSNVPAELIPENVDGFAHELDEQRWPVGEAHAAEQLKRFCTEHLSAYQAQRDFPYLEATSQLSPYLAQGIISPRQCIQAIMQELALTSFNDIQKYPGAASWLSELVWREFYKHILYFFPAVSHHQPFKPETSQLVWRDSEPDFKAWCAGQTGFPIVDAAMRQLNQVGWMHNRLRMVVAMLLTKTLLIDWRRGEKYFMERLIDGDLSSNNGGWQWSASTGTDAAPYFRIFNPLFQSERFDPDGTFIRTYCPELAHLDKGTIHNPYYYGVKPGAIDYPQPIANYTERRNAAIKMFQDLK